MMSYLTTNIYGLFVINLFIIFSLTKRKHGSSSISRERIEHEIGLSDFLTGEKIRWDEYIIKKNTANLYASFGIFTDERLSDSLAKKIGFSGFK